jgi:hypothetical protein
VGRLVLFYVVPLVLAIFCLVDAITSRDDDVRHLPKLWWIILVLLFPVLGGVAWLVAGRPQRSSRRPPRDERAVPGYPEYDRPGRMAAGDPVADEAFLRKVRERAEEQRRRAAEERRRREQQTTDPDTEPGAPDPPVTGR